MKISKKMDSTVSSVVLDKSNEVQAQLLQRLQRLEVYLRDDPENNLLLIATFEAALACGLWERADFCLQQGKNSDVDAIGWKLREGDYWLAQHMYEKAMLVLKNISLNHSLSAELKEVVAHNMAYIDFAESRTTLCIDRLRPFLETDHALEVSDAAPVVQAMQCLWLRALHHVGALTEAIEWVRKTDEKKQLTPVAAGIAALIAIDAELLNEAQVWCKYAFNTKAQDFSIEAWIAQGTLALSERKMDIAFAATEQALTINSQDGRSWSLMAYVHMLGNDLVAAGSRFEKAVLYIPQHIGTWIGKGWNHLLQNEMKMARLSFEKALDLDRNFAESHGALAVLLAMVGERDAALQHVVLAERLDAGNLSGQFAKSLLQGEITDQEKLMRFAQRALRGKTILGQDSMADWLRK